MKKLFNMWIVLPPAILLVAACAFAAYRISCNTQLHNKCERAEPEPEPIAADSDDYSDAEIRAQINDDMRVVALTIFAEARGESHDGRIAIASVIWNRAHGHYDMLAEVCMMNKQFSCWNGRAGDRLLAFKESKLNQKEAAVFADCMAIAKSMMDGKFVPPVSATHYHSRNVRPLWARGMTRVAVIGRHVFYRA
jgi:spore germination cell wall hydrolase CwlJ-like protein